MNLIANSGIQYYSMPLEINLNDNFKMHFHEWFDIEDSKLKLELAHKFSEEDIWVRKNELSILGYLSNNQVGHYRNNKFVNYKWEEIVNDFEHEGYQPIRPMETEDGGTDCFSITLNKCRFEKFENIWLPFPYFKVKDNGHSDFGPTNWCRFKLIPESVSGNKRKYTILLVFDTRTSYEGESFEEDDLNETPVFSSEYDKVKEFELCNNEISLVDFCSESRNCEWVDEYLLHIYHGQKKIDDLKIKKPKMSYLSQYIYLLGYIQQLNILPSIKLFSDKKVVFGDVDIVLDIGNSRTCAVLFDDGDFTRVEPLGLQNFTTPLKNGKLNRLADSFDMRLAFRSVGFGVSNLKQSMQFVFPSMVRLGCEANELIYQAVNLNTGVEKITTFSSPKRYLWDRSPQEKDWEFVALEGEVEQLVHIKGVSEQLNFDGTLNTTGEGGIDKYYSRRALMTFAMLEILAQAKMQINSYTFRHKWGNEDKPRRLGRIIITCPTAMSKVEQVALRKCAEDASIILDRFYAGTFYDDIEEKDHRKKTQVVPSAKDLMKTEERTEWFYDEATCSQFVYVYAEITKRYLNNSDEYFNFYGKHRNDLGEYDKKSLTIGSVDIGAGTTDVMIAAYKYHDEGQCKLTPVPLFWESFYKAGDDLLNRLIREVVIEGPHAVVKNVLEKQNLSDITALILDFFGSDNARQSVTHRQIRNEFNLQVSVPIALQYLEILNNGQIEKAVLNYSDIFSKNKPSERVLKHFEDHFGFKIEAIQWSYDKNVISKIVESTFDPLASKISTLLSYYGCDIVLLSGRPTSLKPLSNLFLKYYAISPNRLITLNDYRIGSWYPFQDGKGNFEDTKSIVAVGAMIGNYASTKGSLNGFSLDFRELKKHMLPTTDYFAKSLNGLSFLSPELNNTILEVSQLPMRIWTRQLDTKSYPTRPFFVLDFNKENIKSRLINKLGLDVHNRMQVNDAVTNEIMRLEKLTPLKFTIERDYLEDKELLIIESVEDCNYEDLPINYFRIQVQSMIETDNYWLDTGEFSNLSI
ncbi:virulence factor SrfB [Flavivirga jejuensis]|uniref:Virulence factor SrfB n=1 Tax=Flavivirga jejuensis TaxID=870487 RepID=A0ABT8WUS3_9FLAO|nr:virulence factor SrfB [Flavivirga jejuensis]MDO5976926.1 virulence factor SrfB [Flavivirga jejuensis]